MGMAENSQIGGGESGQALGELPRAEGVDALQQPPVTRRGQRLVIVVGETFGPESTEDAHGQVLVDQDHGRVLDSACSVAVVVAAEERVGGNVGVEGVLELVDQVAGGHPLEQLAPLGGQPRVTGPTPAAALLQQLLTDAHLSTVPANVATFIHVRVHRARLIRTRVSPSRHHVSQMEPIRSAAARSAAVRARVEAVRTVVTELRGGYEPLRLQPLYQCLSAGGCIQGVTPSPGP